MSNLDFDPSVPYVAEHLDLGMTKAGTWHLVKESPSGALAPICGSGGRIKQVVVDGDLIINETESICLRCMWTDKLNESRPPVVSRCIACGYEFSEHASWYEMNGHRHISIKENVEMS